MCCAAELPLAKIILLTVYHFAPQALDSGGQWIESSVNPINYRYTRHYLLLFSFLQKAN